MKRIIIIVLAVVIAVLPIFVLAQPRYESDFSFLVSVNGKSTKTDTEYIYIYNKDIIDFSLNIKTNEDFFAGPFCTELFYTNEYLTEKIFNWNINSKFYNCCKTYSNFLLQDDGCYKIDMIPSSVDCKSAPNSLDETLFTVSFVSKGKRGDVAQIQIPKSSIRNEENPFGAMYLACYIDGGDFNGERYDFGDEIKIDVSQANVKFKITDAGDVNQDGKTTSADALNIVQKATGAVEFDQQKLTVADINSDGRVNSTDALGVLQVATGMKTINDILNG